MNYNRDGKTVVKADTPLKNLSAWDIITSDVDRELNIRTTDQAAIIMVADGCIAVCIEDKNMITVNEGEMFLLPTMSGSICHLVERTKAYICNFHPDALLVFNTLSDELQPAEYDHAEGAAVLSINNITKEYLSLLGRYMRLGICTDDLLHIKRQEFFALLFTTYNRKQLSALIYPIIGPDVAFRKAVLLNGGNAKCINELAFMMNYSKGGFVKKFTRIFGEAPYKWMLRHKAGMIYDKIVEGQLSLREIADVYNFSSYSYFSQFCKTHYGASPAQILRNKRLQERHKT